MSLDTGLCAEHGAVSTQRNLKRVGFVVSGVAACVMLVAICGSLNGSIPTASGDLNLAIAPSTNGKVMGTVFGYEPQLRRAVTRVRAMQDRIIGSTPLAKLAITAIESNNRRNMVRDVSMRADAEGDEVKAVTDQVSSMDDKAKQMLDEIGGAVALKAQDMSGVTAPMGFFDPLGFATDISDGKLLFYREVELKHGRVAMLASLGILVGEKFHPLFGGNIDVPSYIAFQQTPLQTFWPIVIAAIAVPEAFSVGTFVEPNNLGGFWEVRSDRTPGNLGFDPLGLRPKDNKEFKELQTKELNNGRLAMIAAAGMIAQELATGQKLF
jgi:hypothetical protein